MNRSAEIAKVQDGAQSKDIAVDLEGNVICDMYPDHKPFEVIKGYIPSSKRIWMAVDDHKKNGGEKLWRDDLTLTEEEKLISDEAMDPKVHSHYIIVGYGFRVESGKGKEAADPKGLKMMMPDTETGKFGTQKPDVLKSWTGQDMWLVVRPKGTSVNKLFALCCPRDGLCGAGSVPWDEVFFRWEYRSAVAAKQARRQNVKAALEKAARVVNQNDADEDGNEVTAGGKAIGLPVRVLKRHSLGAEVAILAASWKSSHNPWFLKQLVQLLEQIDTDAEYRPSLSNEHLRKFVEDETPWPLVDEEHDDFGKKFFDEALKMWPSLEATLSIEMAAQIHNSLVRNDIEMEYRLLGPFLREATYQLDRKTLVEIDEEELDKIVGEAHRVTWNTAGLPSSQPRINVPKDTMLIAAILAKLKEIRKGSIALDDAFKDSGGDALVPVGLDGVWKRITDRQESASVRGTLFQAIRTIFDFIKTKEHSSLQSIDELIIVLDQLVTEKAKDK